MSRVLIVEDETALVDFYGALYHFSGFSNAQNDPKIMALMQDAASESWLVTARGEPALDMVCGTLTQAFVKQSLKAVTRPAVNGRSWPAGAR